MFTFYRASAVSRDGGCVGDEHGQGRSRDYTGIRMLKSPYFSILKSSFSAAQNSPISETLVNEHYVLSSNTLLFFEGTCARSCQRNRRGCPQRKRSYFPSFMHNILVRTQSRCSFPQPTLRNASMSQTLLAMAKDLVMAQIAAHRLSPD